ANGDGAIGLSDAIFTLNFLFTGGSPPPCEDAADANDSGTMDLSDAVFTLGFLFLGTAAPPGPGTTVAGPDPTPDNLTCGEDKTTVVGEEGGQVEGPNGIVLMVPPGAFSGPT